MTSILARFPKVRPPLPDAYRSIHERHIIANRRAAYHTTALSSRLEGWMHLRVAADARDGTAGPTLEIGAGTLNHLPYEPATTPYDVVEPFARLYADSPWRDRVRRVFASIEDVPAANRYARILAIATFEHLERLPEITARCAVLLAEGGSLRVGIPNEGTILWRLGTAITGAEFRLRYGLDYRVMMRHEHVNTADEIEAVLRCLFGDVRVAVCGVSRQLALYRFLDCRLPDTGLARRLLFAWAPGDDPPDARPRIHDGSARAPDAASTGQSDTMPAAPSSALSARQPAGRWAARGSAHPGPPGFPALIKAVLSPLLTDTDGVALAGFPHHWNIGDSVIWAGCLQVLRELGIPIRYVCTPKTYDATDLRLHLPDGPVLLTGGGNFGDVYLDEVSLRRRVIEDFPDRRVIQLPQSVWFRTQAGRDEVRRLVDGHPAVTLLLREQQSLDMARELFQAPSLLCPDLALALEDLLPPAPAATRDVMGLVRGDIESLAGPASAHGEGFSDWPREEQTWRDGWSDAGRRAWDAVDAWHGLGERGRLPMPAALEASETLARERTRAGAALLCAGRAVVTDRLHAALVAWLVGRPAVLVDSVSGKSRATVETWFRGVAGLHAAPDWTAGLELAARLAGHVPPG